jgi:hypothetical protein
VAGPVVGHLPPSTRPATRVRVEGPTQLVLYKSRATSCANDAGLSIVTIRLGDADKWW